MPNKEQQSTKASKASPRSAFTAPRRLQQPVEIKDDNYRLKAEDILQPLSSEVNPSHIVVKDVSEIESLKDEMEVQPSKPLTRSQFPSLTETKPDPSGLISGSAWAEPLSTEVLQAPMKEAPNKENGITEKIDNSPKNKESVVPSKDGPIPKTQAESAQTDRPPSRPPSQNSASIPRTVMSSPPPLPTPPHLLNNTPIKSNTELLPENKSTEINPSKIIIKKAEETTFTKMPKQKSIKPHEFPPLPSTDTTSSSSNVSSVTSNVVPAVPIESVWDNPLPSAISTPDPIVHTIEKEKEPENRTLKEEKKERNKEPVVPTKQGPLPKDQLMENWNLQEGDTLDDEEEETEQIEETQDLKEKMEITKEAAKEKLEITKEAAKETLEITKDVVKDKIEIAKEVTKNVANETKDFIKENALVAKELVINKSQETKEYIKEKAMDAKELVKETLEVGKEKAENAAKLIESKVEEGAEMAKDKLIDLKEKTKETLSNAKDLAVEKAELAKEKLEDVVDATKEKLENAVDATKEKLEDVMDATKEKLDEASEQVTKLKKKTIKKVQKVPPVYWAWAALAGYVIYGLRNKY